MRSVDLLAPWHMGALHAYEQVLVYLLAFAPPVLVAAVIWVRRRQDRRDDDAGPDSRSPNVAE